MINECKNLKDKFLTELNDNYMQKESQFEYYDTVLTKNFNQYEYEQLKQNIYSCQNFIKDIQNYELNLNEKLKKFSFIPNDEWYPDTSIIGRINQNAHVCIDKIKKSKPNIINLENSLKSLSRLYSLSDNKLIATSTDQNSIFIFDKNFNYIQLITNINNLTLKSPMSICSDSYENVYVCDFGNNRIIITDYEFINVKKIIFGNKNNVGMGFDFGQFSEPIDICYHLNSLYVLDKHNSHVQVFSSNGDFKRQLVLYASSSKMSVESNSNKINNLLLERPNRIGVNNLIVAVLDVFRKAYIYDLSNGELKQVIKSFNSTIMCLIDNYLFTCNRDGTLTCYQQNQYGKENKFIQVFDRTIDILKESKSQMCFFNEQFIVALNDSKSLVIL